MATGVDPSAGAASHRGDVEHEHMSAADALMKKHEAEAARRATIEDVVDEEDILHPPSVASSAALPTVEPVTPPMSAKAAGKQKESSELPSGKVGPAGATKDSLDTQSHELFPQLGASSQPRTPRPVAAAWAAKKPSPARPAANGLSPTMANGYPHNGSSTTSSRASTPASGVATPSSTTASTAHPGYAQAQRGVMPQPMSIPGKYSERITLYPQEMRPRTQLKKARPDVVRDIDRRSKANIKMISGPGGAVHFDAEGPVEAVRQALKEVAKELGSKQSTKVTVPASVRPHIIGRQGTIIQGISQRTGAHIQVPRPEEALSPSGDDEEGGAIQVLIEGDSVAAEMARREIESIVNERTSIVTTRLKEIPAEFYPFIAGAHNCRIAALEDGREVRIHVPQYQTWTNRPPQAPSADELPIFVPAADNPIRLSGDRQAVQMARLEIERQVQQLRDYITLSQLDINRGQHQFVIGEKGASPHDFLAETGCVVVMPPDTDDSETLTIIGPPDMIENGVNKVMDLASSMQMTNVDISRQHPNAPLGSSAHARALTRYLRQRREIERLERLYDAHIALPNSEEAPMAWEIYSRDGKNNIRARTEIINIVNGHPPSRLSHIEVDPFYHAYVREQAARTLREGHGVHLVIPEGDESPQVLLVYEGVGGSSPDYEIPKKHPTSAEVKEFERALGEAREYLMSLLGSQKEVASRDWEVPTRFLERLQKFVKREQQNLSADEVPVRLETENRKNHNRQMPPTSGSTSTSRVVVRGPTDGVENMVKKIHEFIEEEMAYDRERDYTTTFDYPQKFANFLIGKRGENIRKYRDEFDVEIQVNDGKVEIKGPKPKAEAAKSRIMALGKRLEDEATHVLKIKPQYHRDLIGAKGSQVNRLQDRYDVRVNFPRSAPIASAGDDHSVADTASGAGGTQRHNRTQAPDEVIIRGPRKGADEAKDELLSLLQWTIDNSHTSSVSVARNQIPSLIGQGGREMESMRLATGAQIDVPPNNRDGSDSSERAEIKLKGTKKQVEEAKKLLDQRAKTFDESITRTLEVDKKHHKALIGSGGANIRDIVVKAGGPDDRRELARMVRFPRQESVESSIKVEGNKAVVDKIVAAIEDIIKQRENQVVETIDVAPDKHRLLIGRGGETRRKLESQFKVNVDIPKQTAADQAPSGVKLTGLPSDVEKAKEHIMGMVKGQEGETVQVPRRYHHTVSDNGQFFRRLRNEHKVMVDHAGQQPPQKPTGSVPRARTNGDSLPLITDEQDSDAFSWEIRDDGDEPKEEGEIPWVLRGSPDSVAKTKVMLEAALERAQQQSSTGYLILPDPRTYRHVIGPGGSQVNAIRKQTGCKITVPRDQAKDEAIIIAGDKDGVLEAKDMILEIVRNGGTGGRG